VPFRVVRHRSRSSCPRSRDGGSASAPSSRRIHARVSACGSSARPSTAADSVARLTATRSTPATRASAFSTCATHLHRSCPARHHEPLRRRGKCPACLDRRVAQLIIIRDSTCEGMPSRSCVGVEARQGTRYSQEEDNEGAMGHCTAVTMNAEVPLDAAAWQIVNDGVMGGVSSSAVRALGAGGLRFEGVLSLDYGGGFASARRSFSLTGRGGGSQCLGLRAARARRRRQYRLTIFMRDPRTGEREPYTTRRVQDVRRRAGDRAPLADFVAAFAAARSTHRCSIPAHHRDRAADFRSASRSVRSRRAVDRAGYAALIASSVGQRRPARAACRADGGCAGGRYMKLADASRYTAVDPAEAGMRSSFDLDEAACRGLRRAGRAHPPSCAARRCRPCRAGSAAAPQTLAMRSTSRSAASRRGQSRHPAQRMPRTRSGIDVKVDSMITPAS